MFGPERFMSPSRVAAVPLWTDGTTEIRSEPPIRSGREQRFIPEF